MSPLTHTQPTKVRIRAITFLFVICSLKRMAESTMTKAGAVYKRTAATEREVSSMVVK